MSSDSVPYKLPIENDAELEELVQKAKDWALMHGAAMRLRSNYDPNSLSIAPFTLLPSPFDRKQFQKAVRLQTTLNLLMHQVAHDFEFLSESLKSTVAADEFTRRLFNILETVRKEGFAQEFSLGLFRSDYLMDQHRNEILQVELNTIASSFGAISVRMKTLHSYIFRELDLAEHVVNLPENNALESMSSGIVKAWELYGQTEAVVVFLVEDVTYNICDQRFLEYEMKRQRPLIRVVRQTFKQLRDAVLDDSKRLFVGNLEVAVVYFRTGYSPDQYKGEIDWATRLKIERSKAIKCPSIQYHLVTSKKIQQVLALPGVVEKFVQDPNEADEIKSLFTEIRPMDQNQEGHESYQLALAHPERYVLKPQREGGGNNIYGPDIPPYLERLTPEERSTYILMGMIHPPQLPNYIIRRDAVTSRRPVDAVVSELGIFGVVIGTADKVLHNFQAGHMLRTKLADSNEAGVAVGSGSLDSPYLI